MLISGFLTKTITSFFLFLDAVVYNLITYFYEIFNFLARLNLFNDKDYMDIVNRIYVILGVVMLFVLAYSLLKAIINPDDFAKGEASFPNLIKNVVISLIIIAILPTIFTVAFKVQNAVLYSEVIGKVILGNVGKSNKEALDSGGITIAYNTFHAFFTESSYELEPDDIGADQPWFDFSKPMSLKEANEKVLNKESDFFIYTQFAEAADNGKVKYSIVISTVAGLFVLWSIVSYCFDLGIRVIKLLFYQIIAPIPVICRILPGGKSKDIFSKWVKLTISTFMEVFVRVAIMYLGVYLISKVVEKFHETGLDKINTGSLGDFQILLVIAFLIMGIVAFIGQAPKLIKDIFGIELGGSSLGLKSMKERLSKGGAFAVGAGIGGLAKNGTRNMIKAWKTNLPGGPKQDAKRLFRTLGSGIGGAASGASRGLNQGRKASSFSEMRNAANTAVSSFEEKQAGKELDVARFGKDIIPRYAAKASESMYSFAGLGSVDELRKEKAKYDRVIGYNSSMKGMYGSEIDRIDQEITKTNAGTHGMLSGRTFDQYKDATDKNAALAQITANRVGALKDDFEHKSKSEQTSLQREFVNKLEGAEKLRIEARINELKANGVHDPDARRQVYMDEISKEQAAYEFKSGFRDVEALKTQQDQIKVDKLKKNPETIFSTMGQLVSDIKMNPEIEAALKGAGVNVDTFKEIKTQEQLNDKLKSDADYLEVANFFKKASDLSQDKSSKIAADIVRVQESKK